jgi:triosephosphate isomerase
MKPLIVVNFKTYKQGQDAIKLAKIIEKIDPKIIVGVQASDIKEISDNTKLKVYSQHVDYFKPGRHTGYIIPDAIKADGSIGSFLNHSEHKLSYRVLKNTITRCRDLRLRTMVFASGLVEAKRIENLKPDYLIFEPPELVGGKISVSGAEPDLIKDISKNINLKFLVGAGIHSRKDVEIALKLGARGIAVSSAVTKAKNPGKKLRELIL